MRQALIVFSLFVFCFSAKVVQAEDSPKTKSAIQVKEIQYTAIPLENGREMKLKDLGTLFSFTLNAEYDESGNVPIKARLIKGEEFTLNYLRTKDPVEETAILVELPFGTSAKDWETGDFWSDNIMRSMPWDEFFLGHEGARYYYKIEAKPHIPKLIERWQKKRQEKEK